MFHDLPSAPRIPWLSCYISWTLHQSISHFIRSFYSLAEHPIPTIIISPPLLQPRKVGVVMFTLCTNRGHVHDTPVTSDYDIVYTGFTNILIIKHPRL